MYNILTIEKQNVIIQYAKFENDTKRITKLNKKDSWEQYFKEITIQSFLVFSLMYLKTF